MPTAGRTRAFAPAEEEGGRQRGARRRAGRARRRAATPFAVLLALLLTGCLDLVPVEPPPARPAVLNLFLRLSGPVADGPPVPITAQAVLDPGVENSGRDRVVTDPALSVAGYTLDPGPIGPAGTYPYATTIAVDAGSLRGGRLDARAPEIDGTGPLAFEFTWPLVTPLNPGPIELADGEDLVLELDVKAIAAGVEPATSRWSVAVFGPVGWSSRGGDGDPPAAIVVPAGILREAGDELFAIVNVTRVFEFSADGGSYLVRVELGQELRWEVGVDG